jgi:hypothetical protein
VVACCPLPQSGDDAGEAREGHRHLCDNKQEVSVSHVPPNGHGLQLHRTALTGFAEGNQFQCQKATRPRNGELFGVSCKALLL